MMQAGRSPRLAKKALGLNGTCDPSAAWNLQRHVSVELGIMGAIDDAKRSLTQDFQELKSADPL
jgi:hypothetical protein